MVNKLDRLKKIFKKEDHMTIRTKAYMRKLKNYLGVDDLTNLSAEKIEKLNKFVADHPDPDVLIDLLVEMDGGGNSLRDSIINVLRNILEDVQKAGESDISQLRELINETAAKLENENLTDADRKEIHSLLKEFTKILREKMLRNDQIRFTIVGGAFVTILLVAGGILLYKFKLNALSLNSLSNEGTENLISKEGLS